MVDQFKRPFLSSGPQNVENPSSFDTDGENRFQYARSNIRSNKSEIAALQKILSELDDIKEVTNIIALMQKWQTHVEQYLQERQDDEDDNRKLIKASRVFYRLFETILPLCMNSDRTLFKERGIISAEIVRFFRRYIVRDPDEEFPGLEEKLLKSQWLEEHEHYWLLIRKLVRQGSLDRACNLLAKHPIRRVNIDSMKEGDKKRFLEKFREELVLLVDVMKRAPIPGGRNDKYDGGQSVDEQTMDEHDKSLLVSDLEVDPDDFLLWERDEKGNLPQASRIKAAIDKVETWYTRLRILDSHFNEPELKKIVQIMLSKKVADGGDEAGMLGLLCEILYRSPFFTPEMLVKLLLETFDKVEPWARPSKFLSVMLPVLRGDLMKGLSAIQDIGGAFAAALPATLYFLYYSLLTRALPGLSEDKRFTDSLLCNTKVDIIASCSESDIDTGYRLAARLAHFQRSTMAPSITPTRRSTIRSRLGDLTNQFKILASEKEQARREISTDESVISPRSDVSVTLSREERDTLNISRKDQPNNPSSTGSESEWTDFSAIGSGSPSFEDRSAPVVPNVIVVRTDLCYRGKTLQTLNTLSASVQSEWYVIAMRHLSFSLLCGLVCACLSSFVWIAMKPSWGVVCIALGLLLNMIVENCIEESATADEPSFKTQWPVFSFSVSHTEADNLFREFCINVDNISRRFSPANSASSPSLPPHWTDVEWLTNAPQEKLVWWYHLIIHHFFFGTVVLIFGLVSTLLWSAVWIAPFPVEFIVFLVEYIVCILSFLNVV